MRSTPALRVTVDDGQLTQAPTSSTVTTPDAASTPRRKMSPPSAWTAGRIFSIVLATCSSTLLLRRGRPFSHATPDAAKRATTTNPPAPLVVPRRCPGLPSLAPVPSGARRWVHGRSRRGARPPGRLGRDAVRGHTDRALRAAAALGQPAGRPAGDDAPRGPCASRRAPRGPAADAGRRDAVALAAG